MTRESLPTSMNALTGRPAGEPKVHNALAGFASDVGVDVGGNEETNALRAYRPDRQDGNALRGDTADDLPVRNALAGLED